MARKKLIKKSLPEVNFKYNSLLISLLINRIIRSGKKSLAQTIVYKALLYIEQKTLENPVIIFEKAIRNISPRVKLKIKRIGGATYQVPVLLNLFTAINLAIRWLVQVSEKRIGKQMFFKLANEILDASKGLGNTIKKKEETHKMAKANKAFLYMA
jgi:small subunit ribosomal protein S7